MSFYLSWDVPVVRWPETKTSQSEQLPYTTTAYIQTITSHVYLTTINNSQVKQTTEDMTTYIQTITYHTHSSILNTTEKHNMTNRN